MRIGLVVDYIVSEYNENLIAGAERYCAENNIELLIFEIGEIYKAHRTFDYQMLAISAHIKKNNLDGIVFTSGTQVHGMTQEAFTSYLNSYKSVPIVNISNEIPGIPSVIVDCKKAYESLIQYLLDTQKCKKIGVMGVNSNSFEVEQRTEIIKNVLKRNNIPEENVVIWKSNFEYPDTYDLLYKEFCGSKEAKEKFDFDTIFALNDEMAYACIDFCQQELNLRVPEDVIVSGFDDLQRATFSCPSLTSITQQVNEQSYKAVEILKCMIEGKSVPMVTEIPSKVMLRESTARVKTSTENNDFSDVLNFVNTSDLLKRDKFSVSEWYRKRQEVVNASNFYSCMEYDLIPEELKDVFTKELKKFGFKAAAVVMYEKPIEVLEQFEYFNLPAKAILIAGYDYSMNFDVCNSPTPITFNPQEKILPEGCFNFSSDGFLPHGFIVEALFHNAIQYGYIVLKKQMFDLPVYDIISRAVASHMASSFAYLKMINEQSMIRDKYKKLDLMAHTDELTGLTNRRGFRELGVTTMTFAQTVGSSGLVLYCDMNSLKKINDTYGHEAGDSAIQAQGEILKSNFRANDIVARLAGDEFAVICPGLSEERLEQIKENIDKSCKKWEKENECPFELSLCLGYVAYPDEEVEYSLDQLLSKADKNLYIEKSKYKALKNQQK